MLHHLPVLSSIIAQAQGPPSTADFIKQMVLMAALFMVVYIFLIKRPQDRRTKEHETFLSSLKRGDKVVTTSGIIGTVASVDNDKGIVTLEVAKGMQLKFTKSHVTAFLKTGDKETEKAESAGSAS
ncbi:MAG: preprotein translocase subunit YajC [Deltaproteobacteria bacterium]|nr:preprotein translocase subunit YajC [bacterium]MCB9476750.1 preprotein translocase subunit YajC [Deltaproteobacteria bacterium]MCB9487435.1 preprotein translocase subunit YajC [Deltaproteobacteria bacterium]